MARGLGWVGVIKKVNGVDPLLYPFCGGQMKIISFREDHKVIDRIIAYLKLSFIAERPPPPQVHQHELLTAADSRESISEGIGGCFLPMLREKSILLGIVLQFMLIYLSCLPLNMLF